MSARLAVRWVPRAAAFFGTLLILCLVAAPAVAADGNIDHVGPAKGSINLLYSIPGLGDSVSPDLDSVTVTLDGEPVTATAELATQSTKTVRRTAIMAIDVSNSMRGERFEQAKLAARAFLDAVPTDVYVGIVAFAGDVETVQVPSLDRDAAAAVLDQLTLSQETRLYEGVVLAVETAGQEGQRSVLVLSDGGDTSQTPIEDVTGAIEAAEIKVDVVALAQAAGARQPLEEMATVGSGSVLTAEDPAALAELFSAEAEALAKQVLISAQVPADRSAREGSVAVSIAAGGQTYTDTAFVTVSGEPTASTESKAAPREIPPPRFAITQQVMLIGLGVGGLAVLIVLLSALGVFERIKSETLEDRIAAYSRTGDARSAAATPGARLIAPKPPEGLKGSAVSMAQKVLASNKGVEAALGSRLEAAGMALKPAEWLLIHAGIAVGSAVVGFLFSSGGVMLTLILLAVGIVVPWVYLSFKKGRRIKTFNGQLADTLQLMSGSLSAGLSLAQSVDTVMREGSEPMAGEFRRALVEARLGVEIEDALESVSTRMGSEDFHWVVMAVRIQREVGGNLAELLLNVAATLRDRESLRRHVSALSAEGRLSAWILGGLPPGFILYLAAARGDYLKPMVTTTMGWIMCGAIIFLTLAGGLWMKKLVKVEV